MVRNPRRSRAPQESLHCRTFHCPSTSRSRTSTRCTVISSVTSASEPSGAPPTSTKRSVFTSQATSSTDVRPIGEKLRRQQDQRPRWLFARLRDPVLLHESVELADRELEVGPGVEAFDLGAEVGVGGVAGGSDVGVEGVEVGLFGGGELGFGVERGGRRVSGLGRRGGCGGRFGGARGSRCRRRLPAWWSTRRCPTLIRRRTRAAGPTQRR